MKTNIKVAALFVESKGIYPTLLENWWNETKDARLYRGPFPVVCHPPCQRWSILAPLIESMHGYRVGDDGGCFASALQSVRRYGGVLEHPAETFAWRHFDLVRPATVGWTRCNQLEWVCEVWQSAYGHLAAKRTWLFYCGSTRPSELRWDRFPGSHQVARLPNKNGITKPSLNSYAAIASPIDFAECLIELARCSDVHGRVKTNHYLYDDE